MRNYLADLITLQELSPIAKQFETWMTYFGRMVKEQMIEAKDIIHFMGATPAFEKL